jgi:DNA-binding transcriptional ArsR family regulator
MARGACSGLPWRCLAAAIDGFPYFHENGNVEENDAVLALAALAQAQRLRIFRALVGAAPQGLTPGALSALLGVPASTLSFHLKELMHAALVTQQRDGRNLIYRPSIEHMTALMAYLSAHCCHGAGCDQVEAGGCATC